MMQHKKMNATTAVTLSSNVTAVRKTQTETMTDSSIKKCNNCGHVIDTANQPWTYMKEGLRHMYYHYDSQGCADSTHTQKVVIYWGRGNHGHND